MKNKVIIIGAGLTGLTLAYLLKKRNINAVILEANDRIGGRIQTIKGINNTKIELGATWFGNQHILVKKLLKELDIAYFCQHTGGISLFETTSFTPPQKFEIPASEEPSFRIVGGTSKIITALVDKLDHGQIKLHTKITKIEENGDSLNLFDHNNKPYFANIVISTLPPNLLINSIKFSPTFTATEISLFKKTHTWMGESIKFAVEFKYPFWKEKGYSGALFSHANLIQEQYDHSGYDNQTYALKGFLNSSSANMEKEERKIRVINQLTNLFGEEAKNYLQYYEKVWQDEELVFSPYQDYVLPHQNNGQPMYQKSFMHGKLFLSGTETSPKHGGYMDGAIYAANFINSYKLNST